MNVLGHGILLGLTMSLLIGPVIFLFLHTAIERGFRAGAMAGFGVWMSDLVYVLCFYFGVSYILKLVEWEGFKAWAGFLGGAILISIGIGTALRKPVLPKEGETRVVTSGSSYLKLWLKGFFINTFNPFAAFFWLGVMSTLSAKGDLTATNAFYFFTGVLGTIILTDILKILLAKRIKPWLNVRHILQMRRISAIAMMILGIVLLVRSILM